MFSRDAVIKMHPRILSRRMDGMTMMSECYSSLRHDVRMDSMRASSSTAVIAGCLPVVVPLVVREQGTLVIVIVIVIVSVLYARWMPRAIVCQGSGGNAPKNEKCFMHTYTREYYCTCGTPATWEVIPEFLASNSNALSLIAHRSLATRCLPHPTGYSSARGHSRLASRPCRLPAMLLALHKGT